VSMARAVAGERRIIAYYENSFIVVAQSSC
jgi:hypothetical protein